MGTRNRTGRAAQQGLVAVSSATNGDRLDLGHYVRQRGIVDVLRTVCDAYVPYSDQHARVNVRPVRLLWKSHLMPQQVPAPTTLRDAVRQVICQNVKVGYPPNRFRNATLNGEADNLVDVCNSLVESPETLHILMDAVGKFPDLLTLEDLVVYSPHGKCWGINAELAAARVETLDRSVGHQRWCSPATPSP